MRDTKTDSVLSDRFASRTSDDMSIFDLLKVGQVPESLGTCQTGFEFHTASDDDHGAIQQFLTSVFQEPTRLRFQHDIDAPRYESLDRLLLRHRGEIAAHLQLVHRTLQFGDLRVPSIDVRHLGTLPEFRSQGLGSRLLHHAEHDINLHGALLATVNARSPMYFLRRGWVPWLSHCESSASPRSLLAELSLPPRDAETDAPTDSSNVIIRLWRRHELAALRRLFDNQNSQRFGGLARDESDWHWLISGAGYDRIYVAVRNQATDTPTKWISPLTESFDPEADTVIMPGREEDIIGYAVVRHDHIVELVAEPNTSAAVALIKHVCADCVESGHSTLRLDADPNDALHDQFLAASGIHRQRQQRNGRMLLAKLLRPVEFLRRLSDVLWTRSQQAEVAAPAQLGIAVGSRHVRINVGKKNVSVVEGKLPVDSLQLDMQGFNMLLLGQANISELIKAERAYATTRTALELGQKLFPNLPGWRMPWEDLSPLAR